MLFGTWSQAHAYDHSDYMETRLNASIQLNIGEHCKVYPSELLSVQVQTGIVSKHNTEIVNHLQMVKYTL